MGWRKSINAAFAHWRALGDSERLALSNATTMRKPTDDTPLPTATVQQQQHSSNINGTAATHTCNSNIK